MAARPQLPTPPTAASRARRLGQVFTPRPVADWMAAWACAGRPRRILDPAVGLGVFVDAVEERLGARRRSGVLVEACDIDATLLRRFRARPRDLAVQCRRGDFLTLPWRGDFDAVLANPPYVRHHDLHYGEADLRRFDRLCGLRLSRATNLYALFLVKLWTLLSRRGRAAVITPAEWFNADFGVPIKQFLLSQNAIDGIVHFSHAARVFPGALTTAAITLLRRGRKQEEPIGLWVVENPAGLAGHGGVVRREIPVRSLPAGAKWTPILLHGAAPTRVRAGRLGDLARCMRGIATGANGYFVLRESQRRRWGLHQRDLRLCVSKARQVAGDRLTRSRMRELIVGDEPVWLLLPRKPLSTAVRRYLAEGRQLGVDGRYLPSHRPVWYLPEDRLPAPIWVTVFARGRFRFVWNEAAALNLTAYHGIYPRDQRRTAARALFERLARPETQAALFAHRRLYGEGLSKVEPRDVEAIVLPPP